VANASTRQLTVHLQEFAIRARASRAQTSRAQTVPKPPRFDFSEYLPYLINRVGSVLVVDFVQSALAHRQLSIAMWRVLSNDGGQRQIDLAGKTSIDVSTLSRVVTRLVKMGLVTRTRSATNSREVVVRLTAKGVAVLAEAIPKAIACERMAIAGVPAKDLAVVRRSLRRMYQNLAGSPHASDPLTAFELSGVSSRRRPGAARTRR
jgi:DNA-binding MarR family transcriptional regulator